jgi:hypothetical protein
MHFENEWFSCTYNWKHFKLKTPTYSTLFTWVLVSYLNKQMNHFVITQESLKWKFINSSTLSMKPNYISMWKTHIILFKVIGVKDFMAMNPFLDSLWHEYTYIHLFNCCLLHSSMPLCWTFDWSLCWFGHNPLSITVQAK